MTQKEKYIYIAGFFDGEGCVGIFGKRKFHQLSIVQTDKEVLEFVKTTMKCGWIQTRKMKNEKLKQRYDFKISGIYKVQDFLRKIYPYLKVKKIQAQRMLKIIPKPKGKRNKIGQFS